MNAPSKLCGALAATLASLAALAPAASAHLIKIREIGAGAGTSFVELQIYVANQPTLAGDELTVRGADGLPVQSFVFPSDVPNGAGQRTILVSGSASVDGVAADFVAPGLTLSGLIAGAVCFEVVDCVSWGGAGFTGNGVLPDSAGSPAPAFTDELSLTRSIAAGCPTLLESFDDTNDSAADFAAGTRSARNNATVPTELACDEDPGAGGGGGGGGGAADTTAPETAIDSAPPRRSKRRRARFTFSSSEQGSSFECSRNGRLFKPCSSPKTYRRLDPGRYELRVRAVDAAGNADPTPAKHRWKVVIS